MSYQPVNFGSKGGWLTNLSKGLKLESNFKIQLIFLLFMDQINEQVKLYNEKDQ